MAVLDKNGLTYLIEKIKSALSNKVDKIAGKNLSTNDYDNTEKAHVSTSYNHSQSAHAPSNSERNVVIGIQKNGSDLTPDSSRKVNITIPVKVSELTNDAGYKTVDTTYEIVTTSADGLMSATDKIKLNSIAEGANKYIHPSATAHESGLYKITVNNFGHVTAVTAISKSDITALGIPGSDTNTWIAFKGASAETAGTAGYIPAPSAGSANRYFRSDGTWAIPPNTTYGNATTSAAGLMSSSDKVKLDGIANNANKYTLPTAGKDILGGVKTNSTVTSASGYTACPIIDGIVYYKDTNTTYALSSFGITVTATELNYMDGVTSNVQTQLNGKAASGHAHTPSQVGVIGAAPTSGQVAVFDGTTGKIKSTGFTINASVPAGAKFTDTVYTHPTSSGNKHIPSGGSSGQILRWSADGTAAWGNDNNTTYSAFKGATSSAAGTSGLVPAPAAGKQTSFLRGDGTWVIPTNTTYGLASTTANGLLKQLDGSTSHFMRGDGTWATPPNTTYGVVTTSANGLMSSSDKSKLDGIAAGANKYVLPTASKSTLGGVKTTSSVTSTSGYTACPIINGVVYYKDTNTTYSLSSFGISASAAELNYCDGVTSNIQTQLNALANRIATLESKALQISP